MFRKNLFSLIATAIFFFTGYSAYGQNVTIPDPIFKAALVGNASINTNLDTEIQVSEASAYSGSIDVSSLGISDLTGIEAFINLFELYCNNNQLTSLDVSGLTNLFFFFCDNNQLTSLDVSSLTNLFYLFCYNNQLTSLDVSGLTNLNYLNCPNNQLTSLNVSGCTALTYLLCGVNQLTSLNVSGCTNLIYLYCNNNPALSCIQVINVAAANTNPNWVKDAGASYSLNCDPIVYIPDPIFKAALVGDASINTNLDTEIQVLEANDYLGGIDVSTLGISDLTGIEAFTSITFLDCSYNQLTSLDVSTCTALTSLDCYSNQLQTLDVSGMTALTSLSCYYNSLTSLDVTGCTALTYLYCGINSLTSLDVTTCTALTYLDCYANQLQTLNLSGLTNLQSLGCSDNQMQTLNVSGCTALNDLYCYSNVLTSLNVSGCTNLIYLYCDNNPPLSCIQVSDVAAANNSPNWFKDAGASYSLNCNCASFPVSVSPSTGQITCINSSVIIEASGGVAYDWGGGNNNAIITITSGGTYTVIVSDGNGCTATAEAVITESTTPPTVTITPSGSTAICPPQTVDLTAGGAGSYVWSGAGSGSSTAVTAVAAGTYCVVGTDGFNGCTAQACVTVTQSCAPVFDCASNPNIQPSAPSLTLGANPYSQIEVTWAQSSSLAGYLVQWRVLGFTGNSQANTTGTTMTLNTLQPGTTYEVRVMARCAGVPSAFRYSPWSSITTQSMSGCGGATIACGTSTNNSITINWASQPDAIGYRIYRNTPTGYQMFTVTTGGLTSFAIPNLMPNTAYSIYIKTQCVNSQFYQSNTISCSTSGPSPLMAPDMPLNFAYNGIEYVNMPANEIRIAELDALTGDFEVDFSSGTPEVKPLVAGAQIGFGIVPNPANTHFDVVLATDQSVDTQIFLTDINGAVIMSQSSTLPIVSFDTQDLPAGVYAVTVKTGAQATTQRLVIVK